MFSSEKIIHEFDTNLGHYQVVDMIYEGREARILFNGRRSAAFSGLPLDGEQELLFDYIQRLYELTSSLRPKRLLMIGGGVYTLPMALIRSLPDIIVDAVEIDAELNEVAKNYFGYVPNGRLNIINDDGLHFMQTTNNAYDLIIIDAFSNLTIPQSLSDRKSVEVIYNLLTPNGVAAINIISAYQGPNARIIRHFHDLYKTYFNKIQIFPADDSTSLLLSQNFILVAGNTNINTVGMRFSALKSPESYC